MKNFEVAIIVVAVLLIGYFWWKNHSAKNTANPTDATSPGLNSCGGYI